ncbi:hypothetical protein P154DRAFT_606114 [Amniculicola lignicola CBS 123094]|uniref:Uncharacterized protein n=1 Tax=Amniculicola lignicola CBS 123094 TaxID=1392246 RepID=A0A6A5X2M7_9PLEO|nr:hypothetical protein P154DRAFT_606114 [Amniculicola lignicola CBS 123094]
MRPESETAAEQEKHQPAAVSVPPNEFEQHAYMDADSKESEEADRGMIPHATVSAVQATKEVVKAVGNGIGEAIAWVERKAIDLEADNADGAVGPYASPVICARSDLDAISAGALPVVGQEKGNEVGSGRLDEENQTLVGNEKKEN